MKIRQGFVSNSSSSSFVVVAPKDYDWGKNLTDEEKKIYEESFHPQKIRAFGSEMYVYEGFDDEENNINYSETFRKLYEDSDDYYEKADEMWNKFTSLFNKNECFVHYMEN